jgi:beta-galactosidase
VDAKGRLNLQAEHTVHFTVEGPGTIAAVGSGDPMNTELYRGDHHQVYGGRCMVVVKAGKTPGEIRLRVEADGLESSEVRIASRME